MVFGRKHWTELVVYIFMHICKAFVCLCLYACNYVQFLAYFMDKSKVFLYGATNLGLGIIQFLLVYLSICLLTCTVLNTWCGFRINIWLLFQARWYLLDTLFSRISYNKCIRGTCKSVRTLIMFGWAGDGHRYDIDLTSLNRFYPAYQIHGAANLLINESDIGSISMMAFYVPLHKSTCHSNLFCFTSFNN